MIFSGNLLSILAALAHIRAAEAAPAGGAGDMVVLDTVQTADGALTSYGYATEAAARSADAILKLRNPLDCGTNKVECEYNDFYRSADTICGTLIDQLTAQGSTKVNPGTRAFCWGTDKSNQCCVSWSHDATLNMINLTNGANDVYRQCRRDGKIAGLTRNTNLGGTCVVQCLSNRPDGCAD